MEKVKYHIDKANAIAFTGHRSYLPCDGGEALIETLKTLYQRGFRTFMTGMSWGFDLAAGEAVITLKALYSDISLIAVEPHRGFESLFGGEDALRYRSIIEAADARLTLSEGAGTLSYIRRNDFLVENSSLIVAWWSGNPSGGTAYTLRRARKAQLPIINLYPNPQLELFSSISQL